MYSLSYIIGGGDRPHLHKNAPAFIEYFFWQEQKINITRNKLT